MYSYLRTQFHVVLLILELGVKNTLIVFVAGVEVNLVNADKMLCQLSRDCLDNLTDWDVERGEGRVDYNTQ